MEWTITTSEEAAKIRIAKTIAFQKEHDTYLIYEKTSGKAIGFAGAEKIAPYIYQEAGICLGPIYVGKGFGKQILQGLIQYCTEQFGAKEFKEPLKKAHIKRHEGAKEFIYSARDENTASNRLAKSFGFSLISSAAKTDSKDGHQYNLLQYSLKL